MFLFWSCFIQWSALIRCLSRSKAESHAPRASANSCIISSMQSSLSRDHFHSQLRREFRPCISTLKIKIPISEKLEVHLPQCTYLVFENLNYNFSTEYSFWGRILRRNRIRGQIEILTAQKTSEGIKSYRNYCLKL